MDKAERMDENEFTELYGNIMKLCDGHTVDDLVHTLAYILAELAFESAAPKKDFIAYLVETFDDAYAHQIESAKEQKGH